MASPKYEGIFDFLFTSGRELSSPNSNVQALIDSGAISNTNQKWNDFWAVGHPGETPVTFVDPDALPKTRFGGSIVDARQPGAGGFKTLNPSLVVDDPNYGLISPLFNELDPSKQSNIYDMIGPAFAAVLGMAVGIPTIAKLGLTGAKFIGGLGETDSDPRQMYAAGLQGGDPTLLEGVAEFKEIEMSQTEKDTRALYDSLQQANERATTLYDYISVGT